MVKRVQWIGHITADANAFIGRQREITVDITANEIRVHDGATAGGHRVLTKTQNDALYMSKTQADFTGAITVDTINEHTGNAGVTVDGVLIKDGEVDGVDVSVLETEVFTNIPADIAVVQTDINTHEALTNNPHAVTKTQVGLANVTNDAQLKIASNLSDLNNAATARTNLGLGSIATLSTIASANITDGTIVNGDINASAAIALSKLATQAAGTLTGNFSGGSAVPTAVAPGAGLLITSGALKSSFGAQLFHLRDEKASGTNGGAVTADAWTKHTLDDEKTNEITGASETSSVVTLPAGTYYIEAWAMGHRTDGFKVRWRNTEDGTTAVNGLTAWVSSATNSGTVASLRGRFTIASEKTFELQYYSEAATGAGASLGEAATTGEVEIYAEATIWKLA